MLTAIEGDSVAIALKDIKFIVYPYDQTEENFV